MTRKINIVKFHSLVVKTHRKVISQTWGTNSGVVVDRQNMDWSSLTRHSASHVTRTKKRIAPSEPAGFSESDGISKTV